MWSYWCYLHSNKFCTLVPVSHVSWFLCGKGREGVGREGLVGPSRVWKFFICKYTELVAVSKLIVVGIEWLIDVWKFSHTISTYTDRATWPIMAYYCFSHHKQAWDSIISVVQLLLFSCIWDDSIYHTLPTCCTSFPFHGVTIRSWGFRSTVLLPRATIFGHCGTIQAWALFELKTVPVSD